MGLEPTRRDDPMASPPEDLTLLLRAATSRDPQAEAQLCDAIYADLRAVGENAFRGEGIDHTLQPTALVHEAYMKLIRQEVDWENRAHFFAVAARLMRRVLVDHARGKLRHKRGSGTAKREFSITLVGPGTDFDLLALDEALRDLAKLDPLEAEIVEMRFFGGQSNAEIARALETSESTVVRRWNHAKAWLFRALQ